jgi:PAS domain S-box-containing protein
MILEILGRKSRSLPDAGNSKAGESDRILQEKITLMYSRLPTGLSMSLIVSTALVFFLPVQSGRRNLLLWGLANVLLGAFRFADWRAFSRNPQVPAWISRRRRNLVILAATQGLLWGFLGWYLFPASPLEQLFLALIMTGMAVAGLFFLSPLQAAYVVYVIPVMIPLCVHLTGGAPAVLRIVGYLGIASVIAMLLTSAKICRWIEESLGSALENEELVRRLSTTNRDLLQSMNEGFGQLDEHNQFLFANAAAESIFGVPPGTLAGRSLLDFLDPATIALVDQETEQRRMGKSHLYVHTIILDDGQCRLLQVKASPARDSGGRFTGTFAVFEDITEFRQAEAALLEREAQLRAIFESSQDAIGVAQAGAQEMVNPAFLSIFGFERAEDLLGRQLIDLIAPESRDLVLANIRARARGEPAPIAYEVMAQRKDGSTFPMEVHISTYQRDGIAHTVASLRDISDRKQAEEEMKKAADEIRILKDRLEAENTFYRAKIQEVEPSNELLGSSDAMKYLLYRVRQVAPSDATVLILGETGTGKELVAEAVHRGGLRKDGPLIKVNCATLTAGLAESELFGHERGAFTGAHAQRKGRFELADGATLFLDEVGELSLEVQAKLLRVLQNGEFQRVGGERSNKVDVRVIAATNRDLAREVAAGRFREDLLYRINVFPITVPPLRSRPEDIPEMAAAFLRRFCEKLGRPELALPHSIIQAFQAYSWPGNVRELQNVIERAVLVSEPSGLRLAEPLVVREPIGEAPGALNDLLMDFERKQIIRVLGNTQWRVEGAQGAAELLGMKPSTLRSRMTRLGVARPSD